jgi:Zn-dependent protease with chaperone function
MKPVKKRGHFAIKFTAALMRIVALLIVIGGVVGGLAFTQFQTQTASGTLQGLPGAAAAIGYLIAVVFTFIYAIILWGFADALVLIADTNDAQRVAEQQIATLMLERRTEPAVSYVAPVVPSDTTERLPPPDR